MFESGLSESNEHLSDGYLSKCNAEEAVERYEKYPSRKNLKR